ncbi:MAG: DNA polymerase III subunit gamma/tau [Alysiella sp.]|uniref:DNA polymerase III subunit gamma/tau n=1 Tax=Alysiella sp. TaxID=1872483 RepID=UPI0026DB1C8A|nr:DNA polymerase III subunit gamma/tau [Alysiella sp.]MDO4434364.1 DNA polymerase III subunit gamma/tau [Alysiella sp.]
MTAYQVLARKWRPKTFADLVGQQHVVKALQNALDKGRLHHAYLLTGTRGVGKTTIARILAKSLNCETPNHGEPCGVCQSCRDIDAGRFVDLLEIDAASNTGIDNIREVLENAQYAPTVGKYKVYIIDEVHMLSKSAFNAMLKTLEEPPEHVKFILATTDPHKVPITVLSRCLQFVLRNMTAQQVAEHLTHVLKTEQIVYEPAALALLGRAAQGSMRDALSLLDQAIAMGSGSVQERDVRDMIGAVDKRYLYELLTFLMEQDGENLIAKAQEMSANAIGFDSALNDLAMLLQRLALLKTVPSAIEADDPERERLLHLAQYFSDEQIQLYYQCVIHGKNDLPLAPDEYAGFVMTLLRMLAFAPFAAKSTPHNATIEGTQLHNPVGNVAPKKQQLPDTSHQTCVQAADDVQTVKLPENTVHLAETMHNNMQLVASLENHDASVSDAVVFSGSVHDEKQMKQAVDETSTQSQDIELEVATMLPENEVDCISGSIGVHADEVETSEFSGSHSHEDYPAFDDLPISAYDDAPDEIDLSNEASQTNDAHDPMPEFVRENWVLITRRIGQQISVAQMLLNHMAWVDFADGILHLAIVSQHTRNTAKKEYFDRIAAALSAAYGCTIRIQTRDFEENKGWETPFMYRNRIAAENRQKARESMEADKAVQDIMRLFDAKWQENSLILKEA